MCEVCQNKKPLFDDSSLLDNGATNAFTVKLEGTAMHVTCFTSRGFGMFERVLTANYCPECGAKLK